MTQQNIICTPVDEIEPCADGNPPFISPGACCAFCSMFIMPFSASYSAVNIILSKASTLFSRLCVSLITLYLSAHVHKLNCFVC